MSLKLFLLNAFGGIKKTEKVESEISLAQTQFQDFKLLNGSKELEEFEALETEVTSASFEKKKAETIALKYKGSKEAKTWDEFEKLKNNKKLMAFYNVKESDDFKRYKELKESYLIKEFIDMQKFVDNDFEKEKKRFIELHKNSSEPFEDTITYKKKQAYDDLLKSEDVQFWLNFQKSKEHSTIKEMANSAERTRFDALKAMVESEEFVKRKAFLENPNRWETTEDYQKWEKYESLKQDSKFNNYKIAKESDLVKFFAKNKLEINEDFKSNVDENNWQYISHTAQNSLGKNFSLEGDLHAYTDGKNISVNDILCINTRKESVKSLIWKMPHGFIPQVFEYTSGIMANKTSILSERGVLEAKLLYNPHKSIVDLFYLGTADNSFRLNLFELGTVARLGYKSNNKEQYSSIGGLSKGKYYIFRLEWDKNTVCWKVNNRILFKTQLTIPKDELYVHLQSMVVKKGAPDLHDFKCDWIKVFTPNS